MKNQKTTNNRFDEFDNPEAYSRAYRREQMIEAALEAITCISFAIGLFATMFFFFSLT